MSKQQKAKISLALPKVKNLQTSVFQRLGLNQRAKDKPKLDQQLQPAEQPSPSQSSASEAREPVSGPSAAGKQIPDSVAEKLQLVRQKAAAIMETKKRPKETLTIVKQVRPVRRSSSSGSSTSSSSSSSSSDSAADLKRKLKKKMLKKRAPSSSSEEGERRKIKKKSHRSKIEKKLHKRAKAEMTKTMMRRAVSPGFMTRRRSESPPKKIIVKVHNKDAKVYRAEQRESAREIERDRDLYERERAAVKVRPRSRSPQPRMGYERERSMERSPYKSRAEKERRDYEAAREKERAEALARCQERQRERERLKRLEEIERQRVERRPRSIERRPVREKSRSFSRERDQRRIREPSPRSIPESYERVPYEKPRRRSPPLPQSPRREYREYEERRPLPREPHPSEYDRRERDDYEGHRKEYRQHDDRRPPQPYERERVDNRPREHERNPQWERPTSSKEYHQERQLPQKHYPERREYEQKGEWNKDQDHPSAYNKHAYHERGREPRQWEQHDSAEPNYHRQKEIPHHGPPNIKGGPPPRAQMNKNYNPEWQQHGNEPGNPGIIQEKFRHSRPRQERPQMTPDQGNPGFRPRMYQPRPSFRHPGANPRPGSNTFTPRGQFHGHSSYFQRQRNPNPTEFYQQGQQQPNQQHHGNNPYHLNKYQQGGQPGQIQGGPRPPFQPRGPLSQRHPSPMEPRSNFTQKPGLKRQDGEEEDNLSEISDEGDEALEEGESKLSSALDENQAPQEPLIEDEDTIDQELVADKKSHANKQLQEEMELDFEEISDGELDEESKGKIALSDALGVDWSSIVEESKQKPKEQSQTLGSGKQKWQPHHILLETGVSVNMASPQFASQVIQTCYDKLVKAEVAAELQNTINKPPEDQVKQEGIKQEPIDEPTEQSPAVTKEIEEKVKEKLAFTDEDLLSKPYAFAQVAFKRRLEQRRRLIEGTIGRYSRALSARQDLKIRRRLCGLPEEELLDRGPPISIVSTVTALPEGTGIEGAGPEDADSDLPKVKQPSSIEIAFQMFKKATEVAC